MPSLARSLPLLAFLLGSACGKVTDDSSDPAATPEAEFASQFVDLVCGGQRACCERGSHSLNEAACRARTAAATTKRQEEASRAGQSYDPLLGEQCLGLLRQIFTSCQETNDQEVEEKCDILFHGTKKQGEECQGNECGRAPDGTLLRCARPSLSGSTGSTCQPISEREAQEGPRGKAGEACGTTCTTDEHGGGECSAMGDGVTCYTNDGLFCGGQHCTALLAAGSACQRTEFCIAGFHCAVPCALSDPTCSQTGVCEADPAIGSPCQGLQDCSQDAFCEASGQLCTAKKAAGQPCGADSQKCGTLPCEGGDDECLSGFCEKGVCLETGSLRRAEQCDSK